MRLISVHPGAVARVFGIAYAVFGLFGFVVWAFTSLQTIALPIGILAGPLNFVFSLHLPRSSDSLGNALLCLLSMLCQGVTGCITGGVVALCFNFIAEKMGGIDAMFVSRAVDDSGTAIAS